MTETGAILEALESSRKEAVLATLVSAEGSSYRRPGARMLLLSGSRIGSISGGCLEEDVVHRSRRVLLTGVPEVAVYDTTDESDILMGVGLGCRGIVRVLLERIAFPRPAWVARLSERLRRRAHTAVAVVHGGLPAVHMGTFDRESLPEASGRGLGLPRVLLPPPAVTIFGAGDDAIPLARLANAAGWHVMIADSRAACASSRPRFPEADAVVVNPPESLDEHLESNT